MGSHTAPNFRCPPGGLLGRVLVKPPAPKMPACCRILASAVRRLAAWKPDPRKLPADQLVRGSALCQPLTRTHTGPGLTSYVRSPFSPSCITTRGLGRLISVSKASGFFSSSAAFSSPGSCSVGGTNEVRSGPSTGIEPYAYSLHTI